MKLTVLGSGAALFNPTAPYRYPASHLVEIDGQHVLLDAGLGVLPQITKLGLTVGDIQTMVISHFHIDHFNIQPLLQRYFLDGKFGGKKVKLHLIGPPGIAERAKVGFNQCGFDFDEDFLPNVDYKVTEFSDQQPILISDNTHLIPRKTTHYKVDAYAVRLEAGDAVVAYSGDSTNDDALVASAKDADIFICEASAPVHKDSDTGHLNPGDAAKTAQKAHAKHLVLAHYSGHDSAEDILASAQSTEFEGQVSVASDLDVFTA